MVTGILCPAIPGIVREYRATGKTPFMSSTTAALGTRAQTLFTQAVAQHRAGHTDRAIALYRRALATDPDHAEACNNLAALLAPFPGDTEAEPLLRRAVAVKPNYAEPWNNLGIFWSGKGEHVAALDAFQRAVALEPARADWLNNLANSCVENFRFDDALDAYDRAVGIEPRNSEYWSNRSLALRGLRLPEDAIDSLQCAVALNANNVNALSNLGIVLKEQKRFPEAIAALDRATSIEPESAALWANFASIYEPMGELERMGDLARRSVACDPNYPEPYNLLGNCEMEAGRLAEALVLYEKVVGLDPGNRNANWNLALIWLLQGDYERGWKQFEWRKRLHSVLLDHGEYSGVEWDGAPLAGRHILVHSEQGMGDAIQFVRYAGQLKERGAGRVIFECPYPIVPLLSGVEGVDSVIARGAPLPAYDVHAQLMSLPGLLGTTQETIPDAVPYISVEPRTVQALVSAPAGVMKIGFVWAGNPIHARDYLRSAPLSAFRALFEMPGTRFFSLQKGEFAEAQLSGIPEATLANLAPHLDDFRDTAAAILSLDLVITVDTSVAHLAGALGKPTWLLLPHVPDFRWMLDRDDSPWYPTMRLFRQPSPRDWTSVFADLENALRLRIAGQRSVATMPDERPASAAIVNLPSATQGPDGLARWDLWLPLAGLADPRWFAEYEAELTGRGYDLATRFFLDELLHSTDAFIDIAPRLGLTTLSAATATAPPERICLVEEDDANADRLRKLVRRRAPQVALTVAPTPHAALRETARPLEGRLFVRVGDDEVAAALVDAIDRLPSDGRPDVILWSEITPMDHSTMMSCLEALGYLHVALSELGGEASLDPILDDAHPQSIISITGAMMQELEDGVERAGSPAVKGAVEHPDGIADRMNHGTTAGAAASSIARQVGIDWELRSDTGWGVYGTHLALELARRDHLSPAIFAADAGNLPPLARHRIEVPLRECAIRAASLERVPGASIHFDGLMLRALGNNITHSASWNRIIAKRNAGVIFIEDTTLDDDALARARSLDLIVAGSHWNEDVLRAAGLTNVVTVLQGIDPTNFHPAPRSGHLADRFVVFSGGKLEYRKGQDLVAAAFRVFRARHPDALLMVAWHNNWPQLISDLELAGHVRGTPRAEGNTLAITEWLASNGIPADAVIDVGHVPNGLMGQIVREADVALFPNRCEGGTNLVAMECMAAGVPTILSANTGHLDLLATGGAMPLDRQSAPRRPTRFYRGIDGWGECNLEEMVESLELAYRDRAMTAAVAARGAIALGDMSWRVQIGKLVDVLEPLF